MIQSFRRLLGISMILWFLFGCQTEVRMTQRVTLTFTPPPSPTYSASPGASWTHTPKSPQIATLLPAECAQLGVNVYADFLWQYDGKGCKLPLLSPDGKYLAYVTLTQQNNESEGYFVDTVRVLAVGKNGQEKDVYIVPRLGYIEMLEWSPLGQLIIWESIWEGPWVIFVYDLTTDEILAQMRADRDTTLQWNQQQTAFYVSRSGGYGADNCVKELAGYDFESRSRFPDFYEVFNIKKRDDDPFGIPYGLEDNLYIEPFGWSPDGKYLWLTVTPLNWKGNGTYGYDVGPSQAGVIEISATGVTYKVLASDVHFDYIFDGLLNPKIVSRAYHSSICP